MPAKPESKEAPAPAAEKAGPAADKAAAEKAAVPAAPAASGPGWLAWGSALGALILSPVASWAVAQYLLLPDLQRKLTESPSAATAAAEASAADGKAKTPPTYEFSNVVVNLAGTMGTRYLKTSFVVTGPDAALPGVFEANKARMMDVTLNVLSSLTLSDLEEPGSKNVLREKLVAAYNEALGHRVADQVYFSDFVVQ